MKETFSWTLAYHNLLFINSEITGCVFSESFASDQGGGRGGGKKVALKAQWKCGVRCLWAGEVPQCYLCVYLRRGRRAGAAFPGWPRWDTLPGAAPPHSRGVYASNGAVKRDSDRGFSQWFYIFQNSWPSSGDSFSASHRYMISVVCFVMQASLEKSRNLSNYSISRCIIILCSGNSSESLNSCVNFHYNQNDTVESFLSSGYQNEAKKSLSSQQTVSEYNRHWISSLREDFVKIKVILFMI